MKKLLLLPFLFVMAFVCQAKTAEAELFTLNESEISAEFADLTKLESYVSAHQGVTLTDLLSGSNQEGLNLDVNTLNSIALAYAEPVAGIPSFLWGCILGPIGLAIVHFSADDTDESKKALYGCLTSGVVGLVLSLTGALTFNTY